MKNARYLLPFLLLALTLPTTASAHQTPKAAAKPEWRTFFDGKTLRGWMHMHTSPDAKPWTAAKGELIAPEGPVDWLVSTVPLKDFTLMGQCWSERKTGAMLALAARQKDGRSFNNVQVFSTGVPAEGKRSAFRLERKGDRVTLRWTGQKTETVTGITGPVHLSLGYFGPHKVKWRGLKVRAASAAPPAAKPRPNGLRR
jgi:hypothetical protein